MTAFADKADVRKSRIENFANVSFWPEADSDGAKQQAKYCLLKKTAFKVVCWASP